MFSKFPTFLESFQGVCQNMFSKTHLMFTFSQNVSEDENRRGHANKKSGNNNKYKH